MKATAVCPTCGEDEFIITKECAEQITFYRCAGCDFSTCDLNEILPEHDLAGVDAGKQRLICNCGATFDSLEAFCIHCGIEELFYASAIGRKKS